MPIDKRKLVSNWEYPVRSLYSKVYKQMSSLNETLLGVSSCKELINCFKCFELTLGKKTLLYFKFFLHFSFSFNFNFKVWRSIQKTGMPRTLEEAIALVRASPSMSQGFALITDERVGK